MLHEVVSAFTVYARFRAHKFSSFPVLLASYSETSILTECMKILHSQKKIDANGNVNNVAKDRRYYQLLQNV